MSRRFHTWDGKVHLWALSNATFLGGALGACYTECGQRLIQSWGLRNPKSLGRYHTRMVGFRGGGKRCTCRSCRKWRKRYLRQKDGA